MSDASSPTNALTAGNQSHDVVSSDLFPADLMPGEHTGQFDFLTEARAHMEELEGILSEAHASAVSKTLRDRIFSLRMGTEDILGEASDVISAVQNEIVGLTERTQARKTQEILLASAPFLVNPSRVAKARKSFAVFMKAISEAAERECAVKTRDVEARVLQVWDEVLTELYGIANTHHALSDAETKGPAARLENGHWDAVDALDETLRNGLTRIRQRAVELVRETAGEFGSQAVYSGQVSSEELRNALVVLQGTQAVLALEGRPQTALPQPPAGEEKPTAAIKDARAEVTEPEEPPAAEPENPVVVPVPEEAEDVRLVGDPEAFQAQARRLPEQKAFAAYFGDRFDDLLALKPENGRIEFSGKADYECAIYRGGWEENPAALLKLQRVVRGEDPSVGLTINRKSIKYNSKPTIGETIRTFGKSKGKSDHWTKEGVVEDVLKRIGEAMDKPSLSATRPAGANGQSMPAAEGAGLT